MLEVSRITRGTLELKRTRVTIADVVRHAVETVKPLADENRHEVEIDVPTEPLEIDGDFVRLVQIVGNLLNNAAKYTPPGGRIRIAAEVDGDRIRVTVRDNGSGIEHNSTAARSKLGAKGSARGHGIGARSRAGRKPVSVASEPKPGKAAFAHRIVVVDDNADAGDMLGDGAKRTTSAARVKPVSIITS